MKLPFTILLIVILNVTTRAQINSRESGQSVPYTWKNVQIVGGGFVDGIVFHPTAKDVRYCRTDMGGAYRWNAGMNKWEPLLDWISYEDVNLMGVESIALDASNPNRVYLACGTYTRLSGPNAILISDNKGKTFKRVDVPFKLGGNENGRGNGERLSVDPKNSNILFMGTRLDGLWKSPDRGITWNKVKTFPDLTEAPTIDNPANSQSGRRFSNRGSGIVFVAFQPKGVSGTSTIYAGCSLSNRENLYRSTDEGNSWQAVSGQPTNYRPNHIALGADSLLYISYGSHPGPDNMINGAVWRFNSNTGIWTEITPDKPDPEKRGFGYGAVSVDSHNSQNIIVSTFNRYGNKGGENIFRSIDGGQTWKSAIVGNSLFDNSLAPYITPTGIHWLLDIEIDPANPDHAMFTTGYGGHETFNLTDADKGKQVKWTVMSTGIEETVALDLLSPPKGAHLLSGIGDYGGFAHWNLDKPSPEGNFLNPHFSNTDDIAIAEKNPDLVVRVGRKSHQLPGSTIGYSLDAGKTWQPASMPQETSASGFISISANGSNWLWTPSRGSVYLSKDRGASWSKVSSLPENTRVISDPINPLKFYAVSLFDGKLFKSIDAGNTFTSTGFNLSGGLPKREDRRGDVRGGQDRIYATPAKEEDLWLAAFDGLYRVSVSGQPFQKTKNVEQVHAFGFGKAAPGSKYPAMYLVGIVNKVRGIFKSDDTGQTWQRINDDEHQWGLILQITGDPKKYGRVYVGTHGRGIFYGDFPLTGSRNKN